MPASTQKQSTIPRAWHHFDAKGKVLGKLATEVATLLRGKHKPSFRMHIDSGDIVVITNAKEVVLTGQKETDKTYIYHTGYPRGLRSITAAKLRETSPEEIVIKAVTGMLPKTRLRDAQLRRLKVYAGSDHPHGANLNTKESSA